MSKQLEMFRGLFEPRTVFGEVVDRFDVSKIPLPENSSKKCLTCGHEDWGDDSSLGKWYSKIANTRNNLPSDTYFIYKEGHLRCPKLPFVKNERTGIVYKMLASKHGYPTVNLKQKGKNGEKEVWWDMHKLVGLAFIPNPDSSRKLQIDHINKDNLDFCKYLVDTGIFDADGKTGKRALPHMVDFRIENLRWCTNSENQKFKYEQNT